MVKTPQVICKTCGQLHVPEYTEKLWSLYNRRKDGVQHYEALVFTSNWMQENIQDEEDNHAMMLAMSKDMHNRGLCPDCGRPNLSGLTDDDFLTEEDARELADMYAEQAAERKAGC